MSIQEHIAKELAKEFLIICRKCGRGHVEIDDDLRFVNDGDGYYDQMGSLDLVCVGCRARVTLKE